MSNINTRSSSAMVDHNILTITKDIVWIPVSSLRPGDIIELPEEHSESGFVKILSREVHTDDEIKYEYSFRNTKGEFSNIIFDWNEDEETEVRIII